MQWFWQNDIHRQMAESCLRCFISNQIKGICLSLEQKFGSRHDFTQEELFPLVLDGISRSRPQAAAHNQTSDPALRAALRYHSLTTRILQTFDPERSNLSTWTNWMFRSDRSVRQFLLEHGIEQVTDWMILNYTTPGRLERVLSSFDRTPEEISQALQLLDSYHQVYRSQLLEHRQTGARTRCPQPTVEQLSQIANKSSVTRTVSSEQVLEELQDLASLLRAARISRTGTLPKPVETEKDDEQFLAEYHQQFDTCLEQSVKQVIQARFTYLQSRQTERAYRRAEDYLKALRLFHCHGVPMKEIAHQLKFTDQPHLSRLLELRNLRSDIARSTVLCLQKCVLDLAQSYRSPDELRNLESKVQDFLSKAIDIVIKEAEREASTGRNRAMNSQFAQKICQYLNIRKELLR